MSFLRRLGVASRYIRLTAPSSRTVSVSACLKAPEWNFNWKPGPYPKTAEERAAAAKKYGLPVEDYEPYPDDGTGWGDYPKLPPYGQYARSYHEDWDMPEMKRNYGEPLHIDYDAYTEDRVDPNSEPKYTYLDMTATFLSVMAVMFILCWVSQEYYFHHLGVMPKQYPYNGLYVEKGGDPAKMPIQKHYTFEPAE